MGGKMSNAHIISTQKSYPDMKKEMAIQDGHLFFGNSS